MRLSLSAILAMCLTGAIAQADPTYHRVTGVAADDALNVRAAPTDSSADIGDLPHDATGIEVIGPGAGGDWGRIVWQEANSRIAMRFLQIRTAQRR